MILKRTFLPAIFALLLLSPSIKAQEDKDKKDNDDIPPGIEGPVHEKGTWVGNLGFQFASFDHTLEHDSKQLDAITPLFISVEYAQWDHYSIGGSFSYGRARYEGFYNYVPDANDELQPEGFPRYAYFKYDHSVMEVGAKGTVHAIPFMNEHFPDLEHGLDNTSSYDLYLSIYTGASLENRSIVEGDRAPSDFEEGMTFRGIYFSPFLGGRYFLEDNIGVHLEIGGFRKFALLQGQFGISYKY